jgi:competence protein ComEC
MSLKKKIILLLVVCCLLFVVCYGYYSYQEKKFEVVFFDVGQGDAILINLPGDKEILIDGGPDNAVLYKLGKYLPVYNRDLELMILTHPHSDHLNGLVEVLQRYKVEEVVYNSEVKNGDENYDRFLEMVKNIKKLEIKKLEIKEERKQISDTTAMAGQVRYQEEELKKINLGGNNFLEIIYPWPEIDMSVEKDANDTSMVLRLTTNKGQKFLLTGDASAKVEDKILEKYGAEFLQSDVLKISHHGSNTASGENFIKAVNPKQTVISVGENNFGHPSLRVIRRLERVGVEILRTEEDGDIVIGSSL